MRAIALAGIIGVLGCGSSSAPVAQPEPPPAEEPPTVLAPDLSGEDGHGHGAPTELQKIAEGALLIDELGSHSRATGSASKEAQAYFDQGLNLSFGFNHDEATRSFAKAAELDPSCGICFWGVAYTLGPNYNMPMMPHRAAAAWEALQKAIALADKASPADRALIGALAKRYKGPEPVDPMAQQPFNEAFAAAMGEVAKQYPDDVDVQVLYAESLMNLAPWQLWSADGKPGARTEEIVALLEKAMATNPNHPGANHFYIHAVEASPNPERGVAAAERTGTLMKGAGHLVHMPAHIWQRVGRYADASEANRKAADSDLSYLGKTKPPGYYPMYLAHNFHFLAFAASYEGRYADALQAAQETAKMVTPEFLAMMPGADYYMSPPLMVLVRFGKWDEVLAWPEPDAKLIVMKGHWHWARGMALTAGGKLDEAERELAAVHATVEQLPADLALMFVNARQYVAVPENVLAGVIALKRKKTADGLKLLQTAVDGEDKLPYNEPDYWFYPVRHILGAALINAKKPAEAEKVYLEDLRRHPNNAWALAGLHQALMAQPAKRRMKRTSEVANELRRALERADTKIGASAL